MRKISISGKAAIPPRIVLDNVTANGDNSATAIFAATGEPPQMITVVTATRTTTMVNVLSELDLADYCLGDNFDILCLGNGHGSGIPAWQ
jgi:hypothetical protein